VDIIELTAKIEDLVVRTVHGISPTHILMRDIRDKIHAEARSIAEDVFIRDMPQEDDIDPSEFRSSDEHLPGELGEE